MKNIFTLLFVLIPMTQFAQSKREFEGEKVKISFAENIDSEKMPERPAIF